MEFSPQLGSTDTNSVIRTRGQRWKWWEDCWGHYHMWTGCLVEDLVSWMSSIRSRNQAKSQKQGKPSPLNQQVNFCKRKIECMKYLLIECGNVESGTRHWGSDKNSYRNLFWELLHGLRNGQPTRAVSNKNHPLICREWLHEVPQWLEILRN